MTPNDILPTPLPPQRHLFDIPDDIAYFNCAYNSPQLNRARDRLLISAAAKSHPWERTAGDFFADANAIRHLAAAAFGGDADGYAIVPAASYGISTAAHALQPTLSRNQRIVVLDEEFPSNYYPWVGIARDAGATVDVVPKPQNGDWTAAVLARLGRDVRIVAAANCHWTNGAYVDLAAIGRGCRDVGAALVVDATQSLGAMPLAMSDVRPDFLVAAGYKWLLCPYGVGLMYVAPEWRHARPLEESWLTHIEAENFAGLTKYKDAYLPGARRFDVGETCTAALPGAIVALEQIGAWTVDVIARTLQAINGRIATFLEQHGFALDDARLRSPHMFGALLPASFRGDFVGGLRARGVFISQRGSSLRFAPHLYVTDADIARLFQAIEDKLRA